MKNKIYKTLILAQFIFALSIAVQAQFPNFTRIDTGAIYESTGAHLASSWFDMDNDGDMDVVITNTSGMGYTNHPNLLFKNEGNGYFKQIENNDYTNQVLNVGLPGPFGDIDNDGDQDLIGPNWMGTQYYLYRNDGYGHFDYYQGLSQLYGSTSVLFDLDNDTFLDLVCFHEDNSKVFYNDSLGYFSDFESLNIPCTDPNGILHNIALGDVDNDGDFDLYISYSTLSGGLGRAKNECFLNQGLGIFEKISDEALIVNDSAMCPNANWVDYDNDGDMDLYVLNTFNANPSESESGALFENKGDMEFEKHIIEPEEYRDCHRISSIWGDLDNDADLDLYITIEKNNFNGHVSPIKHNFLFINDGAGQFNELTNNVLAEESAHTATFEDYDNDGDLDVLLVRFSWLSNGHSTLCENEGNDNSWLLLTCEGTLSNKTAIGTRVVAKANINGEAVSQMREITPMNGHATYNSTRVHFGFDTTNIVDTLIIRWPSGHVDEYLNVKANQFYRAIEDSELEIDFAATNYIQYSPGIADLYFEEVGENTTIDLKEHYHFIKGDTVPEIIGDTLTFSVYNNENPGVVHTEMNGSILTLEADTIGETKIKILVSAGFTERVDQFEVKVGVGLAEHKLSDPVLISASPSPFTNEVTITYEIPAKSSVKIDIYNYCGQLVSKLINEVKQQGQYEILFNGIELFPGVYFCVLKTNTGIQTTKMIKL